MSSRIETRYKFSEKEMYEHIFMKKLFPLNRLFTERSIKLKKKGFESGNSYRLLKNFREIYFLFNRNAKNITFDIDRSTSFTRTQHALRKYLQQLCWFSFSTAYNIRNLKRSNYVILMQSRCLCVCFPGEWFIRRPSVCLLC